MNLKYEPASMQVARLGLAGVLAHAGTMFLAATISLSDLLLNAVALEFVLSVDEVLYETLSSVKLQKLINGAAPLHMPTTRIWNGMNWQAGALMLAIVCLLGAMIPRYVVPQRTVLEASRDALCAVPYPQP